jgi:DNA-binding transcriptional LysR family regulator
MPRTPPGARRGGNRAPGAGFTASAPFVPKISQALYHFRQAHPEVELKLEELGATNNLDALAQNEIEVAIIRGFGKPLLVRSDRDLPDRGKHGAGPA